MFAVKGDAPPGLDVPLYAKCICGCFRNQHQREVCVFLNQGTALQLPISPGFHFRVHHSHQYIQQNSQGASG